MNIDVLLSSLYHREITNIDITSNKPWSFYTHYIGPGQIAIAINDNNHIYQCFKKCPMFFVRDESGNEYPYEFQLINRHNTVWFGIIQLDSPCKLEYKTELNLIKNSTNRDTPTKLLCVDVEIFMESHNTFDLVKSCIENENIIILDGVDCKALNSKTHINMQKYIKKHFGHDWKLPMSTFIKTATPDIYKQITRALDPHECLTFYYENKLKDDYVEEKNKLDAIVISTSHKDIESGVLNTYLHTMMSTLTADTKYPLTLYIAYNRTTPFSSELMNSIELCKNYFTSVIVLNLHIPPLDDIYIMGDCSGIEVPRFGSASGPNCSFFKVMRLLKRHNTVLQLETDCKLVAGWLNTCITYAKSVGQFLISGSMYDGGGIVTGYDLIHINGVAFYKVGSPIFQQFLNMTERYILREVQFLKRKNAGYDLMMTHCIDSYLSGYMHTKSYYMFYRYIYRMMTRTSLIVNAAADSPPERKPVQYYVNYYNAVIIHQK